MEEIGKESRDKRKRGGGICLREGSEIKGREEEGKEWEGRDRERK